VIILLLKLLFFVFLSIFSLKLLIFSDQMMADENKVGKILVVSIFGGPSSSRRKLMFIFYYFFADRIRRKYA
jgi:hypothetical protein